MENLPFYIPAIFELTMLLAIYLFYIAAHKSKIFFVLIVLWIAVQTVISLNGFYKITHGTPPRFALLIMPPTLIILTLFLTAKGRAFIDGLDTSMLTLLHIIRIPVEIVLLMLCIHKVVPDILTFEGRNFDIFSGISAPFVYYFGFVQKKLSKTVILIWNFVCLALVVNVAVNAVLSAPTPFQQFGFNQPNLAFQLLPYIFLPGLLVPLVVFSHLAVIRQILKGKTTI